MRLGATGLPPLSPTLTPEVDRGFTNSRRHVGYVRCVKLRDDAGTGRVAARCNRAFFASRSPPAVSPVHVARLINIVVSPGVPVPSAARVYRILVIGVRART